MVAKYFIAFVAIFALCQVITYVVARPDGDTKSTSEQSLDNVMTDFKNSIDNLLKGLQNDTLVKGIQENLNKLTESLQTEAQNLKTKLTQAGN